MLSKQSPEYISNGHYNVEGNDWMSIWTYKGKNGITPNSTSTNGSDGLEMYAKYESIESKPDFGGFSKIYIFKVSDLDQFYRS
jgi:hypothetical protein